MIDRDDVEVFREVLTRRLGHHFDDTKLGFLNDVLRRRIASANLAAGDYLDGLDRGTWPDEMAILVGNVTVPETYFFRNRDQQRAFAEVALPGRLAAELSGRPLRILSAGCASGEEPYSLAILVRGAMNPPARVSILAVDFNREMIAHAKRARYSAWSLRETPEDVREQWFRHEGREFVLRDDVRSDVQFEVRNLVEDDADLWIADTYDIVFFRNVVMYFTPEQGRLVLARIARALKPGGYLFLGHAETLRGLSNDFDLRQSHDTFYYQRTSAAFSAIGIAHRPPAVVATPSHDARRDGPWFEAIRRSAERIEALASPSRATSQPLTAVAETHVAAVVDRALQLLRDERFAEAIAVLEPLQAASRTEPSVLLLNAVLHVHAGRLVEAEVLCDELLALDVSNSGAHYLLGLCREGISDTRAAQRCHQTAASLDPSFAMPHLHLGLIARRSGDRTIAQRELAEALRLVADEDPSRLILFGGGFRRETLITLCRTELMACGGTS